MAMCLGSLSRLQLMTLAEPLLKALAVERVAKEGTYESIQIVLYFAFASGSSYEYDFLCLRFDQDIEMIVT